MNAAGYVIEKERQNSVERAVSKRMDSETASIRLTRSASSGRIAAWLSLCRVFCVGQLFARPRTEEESGEQDVSVLRSGRVNKTISLPRRDCESCAKTS
jgi:hypothetical protein